PVGGRVCDGRAVALHGRDVHVALGGRIGRVDQPDLEQVIGGRRLSVGGSLGSRVARHERYLVVVVQARNGVGGGGRPGLLVGRCERVLIPGVVREGPTGIGGERVGEPPPLSVEGVVGVLVGPGVDGEAARVVRQVPG